MRQIFGRIFDLRVYRVGVPSGHETDAERAEVSGMQHVIRRDFLEVVRELRAVGVGERVEDDVHFLQCRLELRVGEQHLGESSHVARRRHLVGVLPGGIDDRRLERLCLACDQCDASIGGIRSIAQLSFPR